MDDGQLLSEAAAVHGTRDGPPSKHLQATCTAKRQRTRGSGAGGLRQLPHRKQDESDDGEHAGASHDGDDLNPRPDRYDVSAFQSHSSVRLQLKIRALGCAPLTWV